MRAMRPEDRMILEGRMGSFAFGLDHADSDIDMFGVYQAPNEDFLGLNNPSLKQLTDHNAGPDQDDHTYTEVGKFMAQALNGNPTAIEFLFAPEYTYTSQSGLLLVANREIFLSERCRHSFAGFVRKNTEEMKQWEHQGIYGDSDRRRKLRAKHQRHTFRLMYEGLFLLAFRTLSLRNERIRDDVLTDGELPIKEAIKKLETGIEMMMNVKTQLPDKPNRLEANNILLTIRGV